MPFLLLMFLMLACLPDVGGSAWPHLPGLDTPWCSTLTWLAVAGNGDLRRNGARRRVCRRGVTPQIAHRTAPGAFAAGKEHRR